MLDIRKVSKSYPCGDDTVLALPAVSFSVCAGESVAIVGRSGSGKSTLLTIIGSLEKPSGGNVLFQGLDIAEQNQKERELFRRKTVGFIFQNHCLLPQCTAIENILLPILADRKVTHDDYARGMSLLESVGIRSKSESFPGQLSGGEQQRVAIARALIHQPMLVLADEPTGNLDQLSAQIVSQLLFQLTWERSAILIYATHSPELAAQAHRIVNLTQNENDV